MAPLVDPGMDCEDELPTLACPPAVVDQQMDRELQNVFIDSSGGVSGGCTSCRAGPRELVVPDSFIGGAETCVADRIFSPAGAHDSRDYYDN